MTEDAAHSGDLYRNRQTFNFLISTWLIVGLFEGSEKIHSWYMNESFINRNILDEMAFHKGKVRIKNSQETPLFVHFNNTDNSSVSLLIHFVS